MDVSLQDLPLAKLKRWIELNVELPGRPVDPEPVVAATTLGTVIGYVEVYDADGNSAGYLPVYDSIT